MIKLIIFDWDDVITIGAKEAYFLCYRRALEDVGVRLAPEEERRRILAKWGRSYEEELRELLKERPDLVARAKGKYEASLFGDTFVDGLHILPGTNELLTRLSKNYVLSIITGNDTRLLRESIMPKFQIPDVFSDIFAASQLPPEHQKPDPTMVLRLLDKHAARKDETVFVGDSRTDVMTAKNAGVTPIVVLTGHLTRKEAEALGVEYIIDDVTLLEKVLHQL